ncbi:BglG family transcription antiterminator LicT [Lacticaseibacillus daqingensis]|uniref:BglG family transcription antiterminator LicT n=1 Tax=Lacticaseibacillus daqingensis TaxID=2486014 RepID=UPI002989BA83|nr:PRD domain-containing protein [Lacticaseibacillus daqingensis]
MFELIIKRVLNSNAAIVTNPDGLDVLVMGAGVAFGRRRGQELAMAKVEKTFVLKDRETLNRFTNLVIEVPMSEIEVAERVINYAKIKLGKPLNEIIYVNLTDHLNMAVKRAKAAIVLVNPLKWDIARAYPEEYAVGRKAVQVLNAAEQINLGDDEAAFIAEHFINAESAPGPDQQVACEAAQIVSRCEALVRDYFHTEFDENSLNYHRFITHLHFFALRILQRQHYDEEDEAVLAVVQRRAPKAYACTKEIARFVADRYEFTISSAERLALTLHISRLVKNL